ncbi:hypothetical protein SEA_XIANYUE_34 [Mycobacterium phage XianYue]|nr:hypothetical protein SEA_XIANYUE_34 [Mycobacterium phage XianYue]
MKRIREMSRREREALLRELEVIQRVATVKVVRTRREIAELTKQLEGFERNLSDAEESIENLRSY